MEKDHWKANGKREAPDTGQPSDEALFGRFLSEGDEDALLELRGRYAGAVARYINTMIRNPRDAEVLMQEAFGNVALHKPDIADARWFRPYLYRTAYHLALRYLERQRRSDTLVLEQLSREWESERQVERDYERMEEHRELREQIERLTPEYAAALRLVYLEGCSYAETAKRMNKTVEQVRHLVYRGKKALGRLMKER